MKENESDVDDVETVDIEGDWVLEYVHLFEFEVGRERSTRRLKSVSGQVKNGGV